MTRAIRLSFPSPTAELEGLAAKVLQSLNVALFSASWRFARMAASLRELRGSAAGVAEWCAA